MIDNWTMHNIALDMEQYLFNQTGYEYIKLLSTLILWDEIYYPKNFMSSFWSNTKLKNLVENVIKPYNDEEELFHKESSDLYNNYYRNEGVKVVAEGAIRYLMLSNWLDCDYLPSKARAEFISRYNPVERCGNDFRRTDFMKILDNSIIECFEELNTILGRNVFEIKMPILTDFIIQNTPENMSHIEFALSLRQEKPIVDYRKFLIEMENEINQARWSKIFQYKQASEDFVRDIVKMDNKSVINVSGSISITPSINISKDITLKKRLAQLTFLNDLAKFAFNGRKI